MMFLSFGYDVSPYPVVDNERLTAWALRAQDGEIHNLLTIYKLPQIRLISQIITE